MTARSDRRRWLADRAQRQLVSEIEFFLADPLAPPRDAGHLGEVVMHPEDGTCGCTHYRNRHHVEKMSTRLWTFLTRLVKMFTHSVLRRKDA
jgi:hypothetical protein